ncbi:unnamed protein product [Parnassius apollo]|uniref:(apollo) hypothetical protein n=1 Tax=Parnassius apollo TaxID=110799 RepID=A0A8S3XDW6_PARAO|nr:unnamed protein product [Parnassius apollo]
MHTYANFYVALTIKHRKCAVIEREKILQLLQPIPDESLTTDEQLNSQTLRLVSIETVIREERCSSPLTKEQLQFFENHANEENFQYCLRELSRESPVSMLSREDSPSVLHSRESSHSLLNSQENDPYETDADSSSNWSPSPRVRKNPRLTVISSTSDSSESNVDENVNNKRKSRKRLPDQKNWKREIAKTKRLAGERYVSAVSKTKKIIEKRKMKEACPNTCKLKCFEKISYDNRIKHFESFWKTTTNWEQRRQFAASSIDLI